MIGLTAERLGLLAVVGALVTCVRTKPGEDPFYAAVPADAPDPASGDGGVPGDSAAPDPDRAGAIEVPGGDPGGSPTPDGVELDAVPPDLPDSSATVRAEPLFGMGVSWDWRVPAEDPGGDWVASVAAVRSEEDGWESGPAPFQGRPETAAERRLRPRGLGVRVVGTTGRTELAYSTEGFPDPDAEGDAEPGPVVWQFARTFDVEDPASIAAAFAEVRFSAGLVAYVNGREWFRSNVDPSRGGFLQPGDVVDTPRWIRQTRLGRWRRAFPGLDPSPLRETGNVLVVEVHRRAEGGDNAAYFDMELGLHRAQGFVKQPYLQDLRAGGVTIMWETAAPALGGVRFGRGGSFDRTAESGGNACSTSHEVPLRGLEADAQYSYGVEWSECPERPLPAGAPRRGWSAAGSFRTAPPPGTPFAFLAYGDSRGNPYRHARTVRWMVQAAEAGDVRFVLNTGDITDHGDSYFDWQDQFFDPAAPMLANLPLFPVLGNHEQLNEAFYSWYSLPGNESWYSFSAGDAEVFVLNGYSGFSSGGDQMRWLEGALQASVATWKIVALHQPPHTCRDDRERRRSAQRTRAVLEPVAVAGGVRLVLSGHDHLYGRSKEFDGVTYVTTGGGGAGLYAAVRGSDQEVCESINHFVLVRVSPGSLDVSAIGEDAEEIDRFRIVAGGTP